VLCDDLGHLVRPGDADETQMMRFDTQAEAELAKVVARGERGYLLPPEAWGGKLEQAN
jgi:hypothetical protein